MSDVFRRHSTFLGLLACCCTTVATGGLTHWNIPATFAAFWLSLFVFPRLFYGRNAVRELDAYIPPAAQCPHDLGYLKSDGVWIGDTDRVENAYLESRLAGYHSDGTPSDPDALRKLAEEAQ